MMKIRVLESQLRIATIHTRMPFRYGIVSMTKAPHLFVELLVEVGGRTARGISADHLPPKWLTKDPATKFRDDVTNMLAVIEQAIHEVFQLGAMDSVFEAWRALYAAQKTWGEERGFPPLLWNFGVSLVERAMIDAFCRATQKPFAQALSQNAFGIRLTDLDPNIGGEPRDWLPPEPLQEIIVRHTVGLTDPLTDQDIPEHERLEDGLPQSLMACVATYGLTHLKIKLAGNPERDAERLERIAALLGNRCVFTLDGNENYLAVEPFRILWEGLLTDPALAEFMRGLIVVEQPLHRDVALTDLTTYELTDWPEHPPMIIDESDGELDSLPRALQCGYTGTSHKNCKGVFKGVLNACRLRQRATTGVRVDFTAEDLSNIGPVALPQDLAVVAALGIPHAERNGHHYFAGLSPWPVAIQQAMLAAHGDLYQLHRADFPTLRVKNGRIAVRSVLEAPFGCGALLDLSLIPRLAEWTRRVISATPIA